MGFMPVEGSRLYGSVARTVHDRAHRAVTALKLWRGQRPQTVPPARSHQTGIFDEHFLKADMAKDLPYFKFNVSEYINGNITLEDFYTQGVFINVCAIYWFRSGKVTLSEIKRRLSKAKATAFEKLIKNDLIKIDGDTISISFLDEQLNERSQVSETNSHNGKLGGRPKKTEPKPTALIPESESIPKKSNIEEKREEEKREREEYHTHGTGSVFITIAKRYANEKIHKIYSLQEYFAYTAQVHSLEESGWTRYDEFIKANSGKMFNEPDHLYNTFRNFCKDYTPPPRAPNKFQNAEYNKSLWSVEAWEERYKDELNTNPEFRKHFGYGELSASTSVGIKN